jgi:hypothetical protein
MQAMLILNKAFHKHLNMHIKLYTIESQWQWTQMLSNQNKKSDEGKQRDYEQCLIAGGITSKMLKFVRCILCTC